MGPNPTGGCGNLAEATNHSPACGLGPIPVRPPAARRYRNPITWRFLMTKTSIQTSHGGGVEASRPCYACGQDNPAERGSGTPDYWFCGACLEHARSQSEWDDLGGGD